MTKSNHLPAIDPMDWIAFRRRYEDEEFSRIKPDTRSQSRIVFDDVSGLLAPETVADVVSRFDEFDLALRRLDYSPKTIKQKLYRLRGILRFAYGGELPAAIPAAGPPPGAGAIVPAESPDSTWRLFRRRYERDVLAFFAVKTQADARSILNELERLLAPSDPADLTADRLSGYQATLREGGNGDWTIRRKLRRIRSMLRWAQRRGIIGEAPTIENPRRSRGSKLMKGRPITEEEFARMLAATAEIVGRQRALSWRHYLRGLWASGLRLAESLELRWDEWNGLYVDLSAGRPMLRIPAEMEKGAQDRLLPMAPEFAEFLLATPERERAGYVFRPKGQRVVVHGRLPAADVGKSVSRIGRAAAIIVGKGRGGKSKYASAHDLRRSFGERWASRVMPAVLMELMRHESIDTTLKFYVGRDAQRTAEILWEAHAAAGKLASERSAV